MHRIAVAPFAVLFLATPSLGRAADSIATEVAVVAHLPDGKIPEEPELRLVPVFASGRPASKDGERASGFRVVELKRGTALADIGVVEGDLLMAVNGRPLETSRDVFLVWNDLRHGQRGVLDLVRDGQVQTFAYSVP